MCIFSLFLSLSLSTPFLDENNYDFLRSFPSINSKAGQTPPDDVEWTVSYACTEASTCTQSYGFKLSVFPVFQSVDSGKSVFQNNVADNIGGACLIRNSNHVQIISQTGFKSNSAR